MSGTHELLTCFVARDTYRQIDPLSSGDRTDGGGPVGESSTVSTADPAAVSIDPPSARPGRDAPEPAPSAVREDLPSERLARLADRAAAALALPGPVVDHERQLPAEALARVLDAVEASTAAATKKAYRSDWDRFAGWAGRRRFPPLPTPPAVLAHYVTEAAAEQTGIGKWRYAPATLTRWVASINQVHTAAGLDPPAAARSSAAPCPGSAASGPPRRTGAPRCCWPTSAP